MLREVKKFTAQMIAGANVVTILLMLFVGYSGYLEPGSHSTLTNAGLIFPVLLCINLAFLILWIFAKPRFILIPLVGFLICYKPVRAYCPLNIRHNVPDGAIKVLSYNVWVFAEGEKTLDYIAAQKADIVCLQEASPYEVGQERIDSIVGRHYRYSDTALYKGDVLAIYSRFPILHKERIRYASAGNQSVAFTLDVDGEELVVINNHLESMRFSDHDKKQFKKMLKGHIDNDSTKQESMRLIDKLGKAARKRAPQARAIAQYIREHAYGSILCVGDFNDSPLSYTHHTIAKELTDCYIASGNGPGISYHHSGFFVRIDNILCSKDWEPYRCYVDNSTDTSDHYPIICWLKKRSKTLK